MNVCVKCIERVFLRLCVTCEQHQGTQAGERRHVEVETLQVSAKVSDGVQPFSEATQTL